MRRGDIYFVDIDPTEGSEQRGTRPVVVVSPDQHGRHFPAIVCPITNGGASSRDAGFTVALAGHGLKTTGVVLCHQMRALDLSARRVRRIERAPDAVVAEILAVLQDIFAD